MTKELYAMCDKVMCDKVLYEEMTPEEFDGRLRIAPIAYLSLGTLEWHGKHLPLGSDGLQSKGFFVRLAQITGGIVLPMIFLGPDVRQTNGAEEYYGMDIFGFEQGCPRQLPGSAYWIEDDLFIALIRAILKQLRRTGFRIVVAHGHGPSTHLFRKHMEILGNEFDLKLFVCWRDDESDGFGIQTDHAAANETSLMMELYPSLVKMENLDSDPNRRPLAVMGDDPRIHANAAVGKKSMQIQLSRMAALLNHCLRNLRDRGRSFVPLTEED